MTRLGLTGGVLQRRHLGRESRRPQISHGLSFEACVAAREGPRSGEPDRVRIGRAESKRIDYGQRQRRRREVDSSRTMTKSQSRIRCRSTKTSWSAQNGVPTTGLLTAVRFIKDNRLLPAGFQKGKVEQEIAPQGGAMTDDDFAGGGDRIRYCDPAGRRAGAAARSMSSSGSSRSRIAGHKSQVVHGRRAAAVHAGTTMRCHRGRL